MSQSYAEHNEKKEETIHQVGIKPEFLYQKKRSGEYADEVKRALENNETIKRCRSIRKAVEKTGPDFHFVKCGKDTITDLRWLGNIK